MNKFQKFIAKTFGLKRYYEGASKGRRTSGWKTGKGNADSLASRSLPVLRDRSRDLVRNNAYASRGVDVITTNTVGKGIVGVVKSQRKTSEKKLNTIWENWSNSTAIDFDGRHNLYGLQRLVMRTTIEAGECLVRTRRLPAGAMFPLQFQVLEPDFLEVGNTKKLEGGGAIIHSIEFDADGKRKGYWLYKDHPGNQNIFGGTQARVFVPASEIAHIFRMDRPGQNRGIPVMTPILIPLRDFDEFEDVQLVRQKIAASFSVFIKDISADSYDPNDPQEAEALGEKVEPGLIEFLPPGKDIEFANPPGVENYKEYTSVILHRIAAGLGISYEALVQDFSETNYSSARMGRIQMDQTIDTWRSHVLKPQFLNFVAEKFMETASIMGENVTGAKVVWTPPKRELIDPTKEIPATIKAIRAGLKTLPSAIKELGENVDDHFNELAESNERIDKLDLTLDSDPRKVTVAGIAQGDFLPQGDEE